MSSQDQIHTFAADALNTSVRICIDLPSQRHALHAANEAFLELERLEKLLSRFEDGSDIWQLNQAPIDTPVLLAPETWECLRIACQISELTNGAFDITYGYLYDLWKSTTPTNSDRTQSSINCGMNHLFVDPENAVATRLAENISIDLGGIGKGYISDKMADILEEWEINSAMINCGGSTILALDPPQGKTGWSITCDGREFNIRQGAVSASGLAQQPNHIVDHHTLKPPHADTRTWTMAPTAAIADALSTAAMLMPDSEIKKLQQKCPEIKIYH